MWDEGKQARLDALRDKEEQGALCAEEERELCALYAELDAEEAERLRPAIERVHQDAEVLHQRNARLSALVARRRQLLEQMRLQIARWLDEDERLQAEAGSLLTAGGSR